jgi:hypothetical protein
MLRKSAGRRTKAVVAIVVTGRMSITQQLESDSVSSGNDLVDLTLWPFFVQVVNFLFILVPAIAGTVQRSSKSACHCQDS